ncbi:MAG: hypothetical protein PHU42_02040 [Patescibacteria group bacterium]|nr:hypothetical protein [Patescibacteria group bacterium]
MLNFIDFNQIEVCDKTSETIKQLGLIAVATDVSRGIIMPGEDEKYRHDTSKPLFSLGFTLVPGMNTLAGHDGFDLWLNFLLNKKWAELEIAGRELTRSVLGPKRMG